METGLWVLDLALLAFICLWAVREDKGDKSKPGQDDTGQGRK